MPSKKPRPAALLAMLAALLITDAASAGRDNGFDLSDSILPRGEIRHGGPPRDGIPALSRPRLVAPGEAGYLEPADRIIGIELNGEARAYPVAILNWHEIVNDAIGEKRFAITYCPLCGTAVAFDAVVDGEATDFGVSGLLYNSDVLLYDRATESLWSQILGKAIAGPRAGMTLRAIPVSHTTWRDWLQRHPSTRVLSEDTGYSRDYRRDPYAGYEASRALYFEVNHEAPDIYHPKETVFGIAVDGVYKAYPFSELERHGEARFEDTVNGLSLLIEWDAANRSVEITDGAGNRIAGMQGFWFAWFAFHPDTLVFGAPEQR